MKNKDITDSINEWFSPEVLKKTKEIVKEESYWKIIYDKFSKNTKTLYKGKLHSRNGQPSLVADNGTKVWHFNGLKHRENGPAAILYDGEIQYWLNGVFMAKQEWESKTTSYYSR